MLKTASQIAHQVLLKLADPQQSSNYWSAQQAPQAQPQSGQSQQQTWSPQAQPIQRQTMAPKPQAPAASPTFAQALNSGANALGFGPDSTLMDGVSMMGTAGGTVGAATGTIRQGLKNPAAQRVSRGVLSEVPGVLGDYKNKIQGLFKKSPEPTLVPEGGPKSLEAIRAAKKVRDAAPQVAQTALDATAAPPKRNLQQKPPVDDYARDATVPAFNPANVPKSQGLLQNEARQAAKTPQELTRVNPIRNFLDKEEAIRNKANYNPPKGNVEEAAPSTLGKVAPIALAGTAAGAAGAFATRATNPQGYAAQPALPTTPAPQPAPQPAVQPATQPAAPPAAQPAAQPANNIPTSRAERGLLRNRSQEMQQDPANYSDRASRGLTLRGPLNR
jgi:hypothetical protein